MQIKNLFDPTKNIYRTIEKVITYSASQEARLKAEITEYIVTDSIEEQFERLLSRMQAAMEMGGENEVGVWVSGFYGSGKSSFTKYLGLALDESVAIEGTPFLKYLQDRLQKPQTKAQLAAVASKFPAAVVLLDLASEMLAGATMEDVSTVLYYKVLQWAGYSRNLKVAAFERKLQKDGRYEEFTERIEKELETPWNQVQNDPLVVDSLIPEIAHDMYPQLFKSPSAFSTETADFVRFENERVQEMLDIVRETTGKQFVIFIIDEVGQYVGSRKNLILNLDGLAKNLKAIGNGKAWVVGTAQQTLTEDDPRASLNSPELYKLKDRFPIQIDLESSDIKEICYRRLLGKSSDGAKELGRRFDKQGPALRHNTKLQDARYYDAGFDKDSFVNLYPFLPAHFDILLHLLGALAKSTGGIGLRSAIKVIQDILVEGPDDQEPVADRPVGWLATTVTLCDALEKDIRRAFPSIHKAVGKVAIRFPDSPLHQEVAKTVAVLQVLGNMPVTAQNVTSLMHPSIDAPAQRDKIDAVIADLSNDAIVPFGEKDGNLCFFSEKLNDIDQERGQLPLRTTETRRIHNEALREAFNPLPSTRLHGSLAVTSGLKAMAGAMVSGLAGLAEGIRKQRAAFGDLAALVRSLREELHQCLQPLGRQLPDDDATLGRLLEYCESVAEEIESAIQQRGQHEKDLQKLHRDLRDAQSDVEQAGNDLEQWQNDWGEAVAALGLQRDARPSEANAVMDAVEELFSLRGKTEELRDRIEGIDRDAEEFKQSVRQLTAQVADDLCALPVERAVADLYDRLDAAGKAQTKLDGWREQLEGETSKRDEAQSQVEQLEREIEAMCREASCASAEELPPAEQRSAARRDIERQWDEVARELAELAAGGPLDDFIAEAEPFDPDRLRADLDRLTDTIAELESEQKTIAEDIGSHRNELRRMDGSGRAAEAQEQAEHLLAGIRADAEQYIRLRMAAAVLRRSIERFRDASQGPVLDRASEWFAVLTLGSFSGLRADYDDKGNAVLVGIRAGSGQAVGVDGMSGGTCDQLYLALRLTLLETYLHTHEPLPFIVDDILIMFDDMRAVAALKALARLSERTQVIFFTHHEHLLDLARKNVDNGALYVHSLGDRAIALEAGKD